MQYAGEEEEKGVPMHHHAMAIGGAHHAFMGGHIDEQTRDKIITSARKAIAKKKPPTPKAPEPPNPLKKKKGQPVLPMLFGAMGR